MTIMPMFSPNDHMLQKFAQTVKDSENGVEPEPWQIYAWCVRDAMAKQSGMSVSDMPMSKKQEYEKFMNFKLNQVEYKDVVYKPRHESRRCIREPLL